MQCTERHMDISGNLLYMGLMQCGPTTESTLYTSTGISEICTEVLMEDVVYCLQDTIHQTPLTAFWPKQKQKHTG